MILIHQPTFTGAVLARQSERRRLRDAGRFVNKLLDDARVSFELTQFHGIFGSQFHDRTSSRKEEATIKTDFYTEYFSLAAFYFY